MILNEDEIEKLYILYIEERKTVKELAEIFSVSKSTIGRVLKALKNNGKPTKNRDKVAIQNDIVNGFKACVMCKELKSFDEFSFKNEAPDKKGSYCMACEKIKNSSYYLRNKSKISEYAKKYREEHKDKIKEQRKKCREPNREKLAKEAKEWRQMNKDKLELPVSFSIYAPQLTIEEDPKDDGTGKLMCRCTKCREYFYPTFYAVRSRSSSLKGHQLGECRLYCSDECKESCPIFRRHKLPEGQLNIKLASRCNQKLNKRQLLDLQVDEYGYNFCEKCGKRFDERDLIIHHNIRVSDDHREADNMSHQILVCKEHHTHKFCN